MNRRSIIDLCCLALLLVGCGRNQTGESTTENKPAVKENLLAVATEALQRNDLQAAATAIRSQLLKDPGDLKALELAGDIASRQGNDQRAIEMYRAVVKKSQPPSEAALEKLAQQLMVIGFAFDCVDVLEKRVEQYPDSVQARFDLVGLATMLGLPGSAVPSLRWLAQRGHGDPESLQVLADPNRVEPDTEMCEKLLEVNPDDSRAQFGLAKLESQKLQWQEARQRLQGVTKRYPDFVPAFTLYGRALAELNEFEQIHQWQQRAPAGAADTADYWLVAGLWAEHEGQYEQAARAFWRAIQVDISGNPELTAHLARNLKRIGREQDADAVSAQIPKQVALRDAVKTHLERSAKSQSAALAVAESMVALGRIWEAEGWARLAASLPRDPVPDIRERYQSIRSQLTVQTPWQLASARVDKQVDLSDLPQLEWAASSVQRLANGPQSRGTIRFQDQARRRGWIHTCELAPETKTEGHWIYQSVGGGVGVIDFDLDGWPDFAAAMLNGKPLETDSLPNRLFRNLGGQFVECTAPAEYLDRGFAQGITVGDFNDDGFPDIFDANVGRNRLYQNNGDGTFREVSAAAGLDGNVWTTSAVIADIDGDGIADLYEVAYCAGQKPYTIECRNKKGLGSCPPLKFEAEKDTVWRGVGDGTFENVTDHWMQQSSPGRGLGVVAGMFDEHPGLDLYIANDMTVNHLWSAHRNDDGFQLRDFGAIRGLGLSGRSLSQASMGMAAGDADGDGDLDFFLTHFSDDHNTYYEQVSPGMWVDRSYQVGLATPSMKLLGFGTEWIDFDNNGAPELIIANGHVDDVDRSDIAYQMPAQLFQRENDGRWQELDRKQLGDYFSRNHLGRALASADINRDGRVDVAITHLYQPVSLLINQTENSGGSVRVQLNSTSGQRDAIGAIVKATVGGREVTHQLTAGDGYMCTNQRCITIGVGNMTDIVDVSVLWPSGNNEAFGTLALHEAYLLVEGSGQAFPLPEKP